MRANLVADVADWPWSSAIAHLSATDERLVQTAPLLTIINDRRAFLDSVIPEEPLESLHDHGRTGRPLGDVTFLEHLEKHIGRHLLPKKPGRKPKLPK